jgi:hypothetical protein
MEADEALLVEWLHYEEHDRRNDGQISQCAGHVIGESNGRGRCGALSGSGSALRASCSIGDRGSTTWTKSHGASFEMNGTLAERPPACNGEGWILGVAGFSAFLAGGTAIVFARRPGCHYSLTVES